MKVLVGSRNPVKIEAAREAFSKYFNDVEVIGVNVDSGVSDQPINDETYEGARNRALKLKRLGVKADYFVGIEGGVKKIFSRWFGFGSICVIDKNGRMSFGASPHFELPERIMEQLLNGVELGKIMDNLTGENNVKQKNGAIGFFTKNRMSRKELYVSGLITALIPFINEELFF